MLDWAVGKVTIEQVTQEIYPFYAVKILVQMFVTYIPEISLRVRRHVSPSVDPGY